MSSRTLSWKGGERESLLTAFQRIKEEPGIKTQVGLKVETHCLSDLCMPGDHSDNSAVSEAPVSALWNKLACWRVILFSLFVCLFSSLWYHWIFLCMTLNWQLCLMFGNIATTAYNSIPGDLKPSFGLLSRHLHIRDAHRLTRHTYVDIHFFKSLN